MKKTLITLFTILLLSQYSLQIFAQEVAPIEMEVVEDNPEVIETTSSEYFDIEIEVGTQSPWSNKVPLTIKFRSTVDSDKTEITWDTPAGLEVKANHKQFVSVVKDQVYSYTANVDPQQAGSYEIGVNVTAWQYNTNYTSSNITSLTFDKDLVTLPQTIGYGSAVVFKYISVALMVIVAIIGLIFGSKIGVSKLKSWLKPPDL